jgi:hypothetical protein
VTDTELESMRRDWEDGRRRLAAALAREPARSGIYDRVTYAMRRELRRRVGQTFTLRQLGEVYAGSAIWARDLAQRIAPDAVYAHDLSVTADAVFSEMSRMALDWTP